MAGALGRHVSERRSFSELMGHPGRSTSTECKSMIDTSDVLHPGYWYYYYTAASAAAYYHEVYALIPLFNCQLLLPTTVPALSTTSNTFAMMELTNQSQRQSSPPDQELQLASRAEVPTIEDSVEFAYPKGYKLVVITVSLVMCVFLLGLVNIPYSRSNQYTYCRLSRMPQSSLRQSPRSRTNSHLSLISGGMDPHCKWTYFTISGAVIITYAIVAWRRVFRSLFKGAFSTPSR